MFRFISKGEAVDSELAGLELRITAILETWGNAHKGMKNLTQGARGNKAVIGEINCEIAEVIKANGWNEVNVKWKINVDEKFGTVLPIVRATKVS